MSSFLIQYLYIQEDLFSNNSRIWILVKVTVVTRLNDSSSVLNIDNFGRSLVNNYFNRILDNVKEEVL